MANAELDMSSSPSKDPPVELFKAQADLEVCVPVDFSDKTKETLPEKWQTVLLRGQVQAVDPHSHKLHGLFNESPELPWPDMCDYIVEKPPNVGTEGLLEKERDCHALSARQGKENEAKDTVFLLRSTTSSRSRDDEGACALQQNHVDPPIMNGHVKEQVRLPNRKRGRPPKPIRRGRPKLTVSPIPNGEEHSHVQHETERNQLVQYGSNSGSGEPSLIQAPNRTKKSNLKKCDRGRPCRTPRSSDVYRDTRNENTSEDLEVEHDNHASAGEDADADDEILEADGPVLDNEDAENEWIDVEPPFWKSGHGLEVEPDVLFRPLPSFARVSGSDLGPLPREFNEFHLFLMLFPLDLIDHIIHETNTYAEKEIEKLPQAMRKWSSLDRHSFLRFLGLAIGMSLHWLPNQRDYWRNDRQGTLQFPNFGAKMERTTFQHIKRFLHLRDNAERPCRGSRDHKLWQLIPLEQRLNHTFQKAYKPGQCMTVGERIIPSKCNLNPCRVYNPKKPHKFGIQLWNLCDSLTGYNYSFRIHDNLPCSELSFRACTDVVKDLPSKGHHMFFDGHFNSIKLLERLRNEGHGGTGPFMPNRRHFPSQEMLSLGNAARGSVKFAYCAGRSLLACSWMDNKELYFASNCVGIKRGEVMRHIGDGNKVIVPCPSLAMQYHQYKGGCDAFENMVLDHGYSLETTVHGWKWWHAAFWGLMDSVFTNAWIIWQDMFGKDVSRFDFMLHLHERLVDNAFESSMCVKTPADDVCKGHVLGRLHGTASKFCVVCATERKHLLLEGKRVMGAKPSRTIWGCMKCKKSMCIDPCFRKFHAGGEQVYGYLKGKPKRRRPSLCEDMHG